MGKKSDLVHFCLLCECSFTSFLLSFSPKSISSAASSSVHTAAIEAQLCHAGRQSEIIFYDSLLLLIF